MSYVKPHDIVANMVAAGTVKAELGPWHVLIRGFLSGAILGFATVLAISATIQTGVPLVGALIFPVGLVMIVLLGLELLTGSFAVVPAAVAAGKTSARAMGSHFAWLLLGNLIGAVLFGALLITTLQGPAGAALADKLIAIAQAKTTGYAALGAAGMVSVFVKAVLCNWMVTLGVVLAMSSTTTEGKILATWLPIFTFFALGYEHAIVNLFVIPTGMMLGAKVGIAQWLVWNALPVTLGNFVGGFLFTGLALSMTFRPKQQQAVPVAIAAREPAAPVVAASVSQPVEDLAPLPA
jgi:formate/nitrite transporter